MSGPHESVRSADEFRGALESYIETVQDHHGIEDDRVVDILRAVLVDYGED